MDERSNSSPPTRPADELAGARDDTRWDEEDLEGEEVTNTHKIAC